jgi:hypothetical protein
MAYIRAWPICCALGGERTGPGIGTARMTIACMARGALSKLWVQPDSNLTNLIQPYSQLKPSVEVCLLGYDGRQEFLT